MTKAGTFFVKKILFGFLAAGMFCVLAAGKPSAQLEPTPHMSTIARATAFLLVNHHFSQQKMDEKLSEQLFQDYFKTLDPAHIFFTQQDLAAFDGVKNDLGSRIRQGDAQFAFDVFRLFLARLDDYEKFTTDYLKTKPSLDSDDTYEFNRTKLPWVKNRQELESLWKKKIRNDLILLEMLDRSKKENQQEKKAEQKKEQSKSAAETPAKETAPVRKIKEKTPLERTRYRISRFLQYYRKMEAIDILELYLSCLTQIYDPHSQYMSPRTEAIE